MTDLSRWKQDGAMYGWVMPAAPWWKRLPMVRHVRAAYHSAGVARHERLWSSLGAIPSGYDRWVLYGIARGMERKPGCPGARNE